MDVEDVETMADVDEMLADPERAKQLTEEEKDKLKVKILEEWAEGHSTVYTGSSYTTKRPLYKAPVETEHQKFGQKEADQLKLFVDEDVDEELEERRVEVSGLDFNVSQDRAFEALQKLLAKTDYQGDPKAPEKSTYEEARGGTYKLPGVFIRWVDYYEAYGVERKKDGKFRGRQKKQAKEALKDLAQPWRITVENKEDGKKVARETPLVTLTWEYEESPDIEAQKDDKRLLIRYKPLFIDKIEEENGFYLFKPYNLHKEINEAVGSKRYSGAIPRFIWWLNSIDYEANYREDYDYTKDPHRIGKEKLAYKLRLDSYVKRRQWNYIDERIEQACEVAKEIDFLLEYEIDGDMINLWLNPARCSRLRYRLKTKGEWPPKLTDDRE